MTATAALLTAVSDVGRAAAQAVTDLAHAVAQVIAFADGRVRALRGLALRQQADIYDVDDDLAICEAIAALPTTHHRNVLEP